jgi:hypothetical protein
MSPSVTSQQLTASEDKERAELYSDGWIPSVIGVAQARTSWQFAFTILCYTSEPDRVAGDRRHAEPIRQYG